MFKPVYVCRGSADWRVLVIPADVGIVKIQGCCFFALATKDEEGDYGFTPQSITGERWISAHTCRERYGSVPDSDEAWLVEEGYKYINWTRVDKNMALLNYDGSYFIGDTEDE